jgi:hypothetical protein
MIHNDLLIAKKLAYDKCGFDLANINADKESAEYAACSFELNGMKIRYRTSKITPTKTGQFVTIWKRNNEGITQPFDTTDDIDLIVISSRSGDHFGQFIFPRSVLIGKGIMSTNTKEGKRGIRVYPPWDVAGNRQAEKTQRWQTSYFLAIKENGADLELTKKLFMKI